MSNSVAVHCVRLPTSTGSKAEMAHEHPARPCASSQGPSRRDPGGHPSALDSATLAPR
jgi:hypothetical protein